ncbi:hypothetical protein [Flavihumibacter profundi]|jgi:hypothetical protein|uniref:hypothetical protein n=1 Tax=Flavihumibacter profundi TaxID=2716883 RepID=UPI001CC5E487|nr:hypothetical protein [Flavihumibacter profundi]MBZ5857323.1 hypothetical protein [Flavihumibacter profundi]
MRPLIFEFKENPTGEPQDYSLIEYDDTLNLSINKFTGQPAIDTVNLETETFTKTQGESADSDRSGLSMLMDTETRTFTHSESSDSDKDRMALQNLMATTTLTESSETADQDKPYNAINHYAQN